MYSASPKNRLALQSCAAEVGVELLKIGRILDVQWIASRLFVQCGHVMQLCMLILYSCQTTAVLMPRTEQCLRA